MERCATTYFLSLAVLIMNRLHHLFAQLRCWRVPQSSSPAISPMRLGRIVLKHHGIQATGLARMFCFVCLVVGLKVLGVWGLGVEGSQRVHDAT